MEEVVYLCTRNYFSYASLARTTTVNLRDPAVLQAYIDAGFLHIRQIHFNYNKILRGPTNGCYVELTRNETVSSLPIQSRAAKKLINRLRYF